ncbi:MAG: cache domain-containing protein [Lachnospiraceae bacterium]|nr:cache domain-containing protein [Lachnospiraceae bacterium]
MKFDRNLTAEETVEVGREFRSMRRMFLRIIIIAIIPLFVMGVAFCAFANIRIKRILEDEIKKELRSAAFGLDRNYSLIDDGDYVKKEDGLIYKGDHKASGRIATIGDELLNNGLVCTFFFGDTRIDTTVYDEAGNNMAGTKLDVEIYRRLYETGDALFCDEIDLGGNKYYGYYIPHRNSNGEVAVIFFAGKLKSEVMGRVWDATVSTLWIWLSILVIGIIILLFCTIYMVGYLFKHFKNEEIESIKALAAKEQMEFMTLVSREVRDSVDSITVLSDRILSEDHSQETRDKVLGIKEAINSMMTSFNSIQDYSKLEAGETEVAADEYELTELVDGCCKKASPGIERKGLDFKLSYDESMPNYLKGDQAKIRQILDNLLENAVKYTYEGGIGLDIGYRNITSGKIDVTFTIKDTGIGIRKEDAEKLFLSIGKVGQSKNISIKGTGLGLLICKRLVSIMDGRISVNSEIGKGSEFRFTIPQDVLNSKTVGESRRHDI